jgi:hypothetical protein
MAKAKKIQVRQGDVLVEARAIPKGAEPVKPDGELVILARGEATGHHHSVPLAHAAMLAKGAERFLRVERATKLSHQEHAPIQLPAATYEVTIQREYDPISVRNVLD